jgi:hypothetical protein
MIDKTSRVSAAQNQEQSMISSEVAEEASKEFFKRRKMLVHW